MKSWFLILFLVISFIGNAQDLFIKSYSSNSTVNQFTQIETLDDGGFVVAGYNNLTTSLSEVFVRRFNACGEQLWSKEIADSNFDLDLVDLNIDSSNHIILTGSFDKYNQSPKPFIIKLDANGTLIYSKLLTSVLGANSLIYSSSVAANGDYLIYGLYDYSPSPPNNDKIFIARLYPNGNLKWAKNYDFVFYSWGRMLATKDNGAISKANNSLIKTDSMGNVTWAKDYNFLGSLITPVETDSGYVYARYYIGAIDRGGLFSIRFDGSIGWSSNSYMNFFPYRGITRRNGNVLFPGDNRFNGNTTAFLEMDFRNGNIVRLEEFQNTALNGISASDITENKQNEIFFTGPDNRGILQQIAVGKLNDTLSSITCTNSPLTPIVDPMSISIIGDKTVNTITNNDLSSTNHSFNIITLTNATAVLDCGYTKTRGNYALGNDTTLCLGQSITLGNSNSDFDSYLWSTGSTNKTIGVNQSGSYWLKVVSACDTLSDTITITYQPGILFSLGPDTVVCGDSIILGQDLNRTNDYTWSTGATDDTIIVKTSGTYWVEHSNKCYTYRDSIEIFFQTPLPPISLGNDTILCPKQTITLGDITSPFQAFNWSDGSSNKLLVVNSPGLYWLEASEICSVSRDSIQVSYYPEIGLELGPDQVICEGTFTSLQSTNTHNNYLWSTGATSPSINVSTAGIYWLEVQTNCGSVRDSIQISVTKLQQPNLGNDTIICANTSIKLTTNTLENFKWSTGETDSTINVGVGTYWLEFYNTCDTLRDSIEILNHPINQPIITYTPIEAKSKDTLQFINAGTLGINPSWNFGDGNSAIGDTVYHAYEKAGKYTVQLSLTNPQNCIDTDETNISIQSQSYTVPNVFSPNGDRVNDNFKPLGEDIKSYFIQIFNRWGNLVFESNDIAWNGRDQSDDKLKNGVYQYVIQLELTDGKQDILRGNVTIMR